MAALRQPNLPVDDGYKPEMKGVRPDMQLRISFTTDAHG
jgi:hypothetical protein